MANPNPFLFGGPPAVSDNPFMDAGAGMGEVNPFMAQAAPMMAAYDPYGGQHYRPAMAMHQQAMVANPFGDYSGVSTFGQQPTAMGYEYQQTTNPYYDQQMAHMNTNTHSAASNAMSFPAVSTSNAGAALFDVAQPQTAADSYGGSAANSVYSPPEVNPFLSSVQATPTAMSSQSCTPAPFNPFADDAGEETAGQAEPAAEINQNHHFADNTGDIQEVAANMLENLDIAGVRGGLVDIDPSDSETVSLAGEEVKQILQKDIEASQEYGMEAVPEILEPTALAEEELSAEAATEPQDTGFSGIFTSTSLDPSTDTMQAATSHVDILSEANEEDKVEEVASEAMNLPKDDSDSEPEEPEPPPAIDNEAPSLLTGGTAAGLFDDADSFGQTGGSAVSFEPPKMSTGDALFADMPSMPDIKSTGAAIFGISDESAAGTTGAQLFDIVAPEASKPSHGAMTGWDENFDRKFEKAEMMIGTAVGSAAAADAFGGVGHGMSAAAFGYAAEPEPLFGDSFGMLPVTADMNNPFLAEESGLPGPGGKKSGDGESPETPLFDTDVSKPLESFPRVSFDTSDTMWEMFIRHPPKKKITSQRFWKKVFVKIAQQGDTPAILLYDAKDAKDPFQELPLQAAYSLSDIAHQVFDQYTKIFTIKLQYIFYKERAGIRPGQVSKMQKLTDKIGFLAKAVEEADYQGVKEFASDMKKLGVPLEHAPQISELLKLASVSYEDMKQFSVCVEERLFRLDVHRDRALTYKTEEVQLTAVDEVYVEQTNDGHVLKHLCRVRVFFLSFLSGMPEVELGVNDMTRIGLEVVGRHDILPVPTEQWIRYEDIEFHSVVDRTAFNEQNHIVKFQPPDACYIEVLRFRTRPPKARELPMQARCVFTIIGNKVEIKADIMVPYHATKAWGQVPCEDVALRIPLPECWIYQFRTEKHNLSLSQVRDALSSGTMNLGTRMGSVKSAHRRAGKVKGIERFLGTLETQTQELMETSSGLAKYEHQHKAIVWRVPRLPKPGQGSYTNHEFVCRLTLTSFDQMPEEFEKFCYLEFNQPATAESYTVLRSVSISEGSGEPPEKFVKYLARHEYKIGIQFKDTKEQDSYRAATAAVPDPVPAEEGEKMREYEDFPDENGKKDSDSDSD